MCIDRICTFICLVYQFNLMKNYTTLSTFKLNWLRRDIRSKWAKRRSDDSSLRSGCNYLCVCFYLLFLASKISPSVSTMFSVIDDDQHIQTWARIKSIALSAITHMHTEIGWIFNHAWSTEWNDTCRIQLIFILFVYD